VVVVEREKNESRRLDILAVQRDKEITYGGGPQESHVLRK
jgi:hypothetical protein